MFIPYESGNPLTEEGRSESLAGAIAPESEINVYGTVSRCERCLL